MSKNEYIIAYETLRTSGKEILVATSTVLRQINQLPIDFKSQRLHRKNNFFIPYDKSSALLTLSMQLEKLSTLAPSPEMILTFLTPRLKKATGETAELLWHIMNELKSMISHSEPVALGFMDIENPLVCEKWASDLDDLLKHKKLSIGMLNDRSLHFEDGIEQHAKWAFNHIYSISYPTKNEHKKNGHHSKRERESERLIEATIEDPSQRYSEQNTATFIARIIHGIMHVSRVAFYTPIFANLYRKYTDPEALKLTEEDIKLLQIAALFHDAAREDEEEDQWDLESALLLYHYLTKVLGIDKAKASIFAEVIANKDLDANGCYVLEELPDKELKWKKLDTPKIKTIHQKILHDADCLDIIRARDHFNAEYLDFYRDIVCSSKDALAMEDMAILITEARSLIDKQGDSRCYLNPEVKIQYEHEASYLAMLADIRLPQYTLMYHLYANGHLLSSEALESLQSVNTTSSYDPSLPLTLENIQVLLREGKVFARGIILPSALRKKVSPFGDETMASVELRKMCRRKGVPTRSSKANRCEKDGNPFRSTSMLGYGSSAFSNAGFLILKPELKHITQVSCIDADTGFQKKHDLCNEDIPPVDEIYQELGKLQEILKKGGSSRTFSGIPYAWHHTEVLVHVYDYQAIYFTRDPSLANIIAYRQAEITHPNAPLLEAIFLQQEYNKVFGKMLPIFHYSGIHNDLSLLQNLSREEIVALWEDMCSDYIQKKLADPWNNEIFFQSIEDIKILSMYKKLQSSLFYVGKNTPADSNYESTLRVDLTTAILQEKERLIATYREMIKSNLQDPSINILSNTYFFPILRDSELLSFLKKRIEAAIANTLEQSYFDLFDRGLPRITAFEQEEEQWHFKTQETLVDFFSQDIFNPVSGLPVESKVRMHLFHLDIVKAYALAKAAALKGSVLAIQNKVMKLTNYLIEHIHKEFLRFQSSDFDDIKAIEYSWRKVITIRGEIPQQLRCLINMLAKFDLLDATKLEINALIFELITKVSTLMQADIPPKLTIETYLSFIDYIDENALMELSDKNKLCEILINLAVAPPQPKYRVHFFLSWYLRVARFAGLPEINCKAMLLNQFNQLGSQLGLDASSFFTEIAHHTLLEDQEVLDAMITHIDLVYSRGLTNADEIKKDIFNYLKSKEKEPLRDLYVTSESNPSSLIDNSDDEELAYQYRARF